MYGGLLPLFPPPKVAMPPENVKLLLAVPFAPPTESAALVDPDATLKL